MNYLRVAGSIGIRFYKHRESCPTEGALPTPRGWVDNVCDTELSSPSLRTHEPFLLKCYNIVHNCISSICGMHHVICTKSCFRLSIISQINSQKVSKQFSAWGLYHSENMCSMKYCRRRFAASTNVIPLTNFRQDA